MSFFTLDDFNFNGKTVLVRADLDSPYDSDSGKILPNQRLIEAVKTIRELMDKKAKVVVCGHQARPGKKSFIRLDQHHTMLGELIGQTVHYADEIHSHSIQRSIQELQSGQVLLLENLRLSSEEMLDLPLEKYPNTHLVQDLEPLLDYYIQNSFTTAHRKHTSMVGFQNIPNIAGRRFEQEVKGINKAAQQAGRPYVMILGGAKIFDYIDLIDKSLEKKTVDAILAGGLFADLCLLAQGYELGKSTSILEEMDALAKERLLDLLPKVKGYLKNHPEIFHVPTDLAIEVDGKREEISLDELPTNHIVGDIGSKTAQQYAKVLASAKTIYVKGPLGMYEQEVFAEGSKQVIQAVAESDGYSLLGGGDSITMAEMFADLDDFSHVGLAGGATLKLLAGKKLIALEVLEQSYRKFV